MNRLFGDGGVLDLNREVYPVIKELADKYANNLKEQVDLRITASSRNAPAYLYKNRPSF